MYVRVRCRRHRPLEHVVERSPIAIIVQIDLHQRPGIGRESLQHIDEILLLGGWSISSVQDGQIYLFQEYLDLFLP